MNTEEYQKMSMTKKMYVELKVLQGVPEQIAIIEYEINEL